MKPILLYLIAAFLFTFLLGYIDEGYYSLRTFKSAGNILVLSVYLLIFWLSEAGIHLIYGKLIPAHPGFQKTVSIGLGLFLPLTLIMLVAA